MKTKTIEFKVSKNKKYGDYRVDEYIDGLWTNQIDNNWTESQAIEIKDRKTECIISLNGSMVVPNHCDTTM